jgi:hypothetical protein
MIAKKGFLKIVTKENKKLTTKTVLKKLTLFRKYKQKMIAEK